MTIPENWNVWSGITDDLDSLSRQVVYLKEYSRRVPKEVTGDGFTSALSRAPGELHAIQVRLERLSADIKQDIQHDTQRSEAPS